MAVHLIIVAVVLLAIAGGVPLAWVGSAAARPRAGRQSTPATPAISGPFQAPGRRFGTRGYSAGGVAAAVAVVGVIAAGVIGLVWQAHPNTPPAKPHAQPLPVRPGSGHAGVVATPDARTPATTTALAGATHRAATTAAASYEARFERAVAEAIQGVPGGVRVHCAAISQQPGVVSGVCLVSGRDGTRAHLVATGHGLDALSLVPETVPVLNDITSIGGVYAGATVRCPDIELAVPGRVFVCRVRGSGFTRRVVVTVTQADGSTSWNG